ncbi:MAG: HD domain-containing protein [Bacilli bacterium]|nr:HD domain-containing protein [Bacilli bacterium]
MNLDQAIEEFKNYTKDYINLSDKCVLKINHTLRVVKRCEEIAESLDLLKHDIELAKLCGLLHDIGRFEQWKRYETYYDEKSVDHALLGVEVLTTDDYIKKYVDNGEDEKVILNSIKYHSRYQIPQDLNERDKMFCNIVRDADKLDILYLYTIGQLGSKKVEEPFSEKVYQKLLNKKEIKSTDKKTKGDIISISLGFVFDINFNKSLELLSKEKYLDKVIDLYQERTTNKEFKSQLEEVRKVINEYIKERIEC